jgi:hypothetical protein
MASNKIGRYEIRSELGRGAMGRVFLAYDPQIDRNVAIKIVQSFAALGGAEREEARARFLREARAAGKLIHPGIVTLFDVGEVNNMPYLAMEFVKGQTLDHYCRTGALLHPAVAVQLVAGAADALAYAHAAGIVHRDIKPANLMRTSETTAKIMDFGLARGAEANLTQDGALLGTPAYMAPEQIRGQQVDGRSDLFSLGVVLYELLTGQKPFSGDSISSVIYRIVHEDPREVVTVRPDLDPALSKLLSRALAKRPEDRFQNGQELAAALRQVAGRLGAPGARQSVAAPGAAASGAEKREAIAEREIAPTPKKPPRRSSARPFVLGILLLIVAAVAGGYYFRDELGITEMLKPTPIVYEATVRVEPAEAEVLWNGEPLDLAAGGVIRFGAEEAPGTLTAEYACRREEHQVTVADAGSEIALVLEPVEMLHPLESNGVAASVRLNGNDLGTTPVELALDLCQDNTLTLSAGGYHELEIDIPSGATPLEARTLLTDASLAPIPMGVLSLPDGPVRLTYFVDGQRLDRSQRRVELPEGTHTIRAVNGGLFIDVTQTCEVVADQEVQADIRLPALTTLVVFAYPPNAKVDLRRPGGKWIYLDDVPVRHQLAAGKYEVRVTLKPTGEVRTREVDLGPGDNPEIRISFGGRS